MDIIENVTRRLDENPLVQDRARRNILAVLAGMVTNIDEAGPFIWLSSQVEEGRGDMAPVASAAYDMIYPMHGRCEFALLRSKGEDRTRYGLGYDRHVAPWPFDGPSWRGQIVGLLRPNDPPVGSLVNGTFAYQYRARDSEETDKRVHLLCENLASVIVLEYVEHILADQLKWERGEPLWAYVCASIKDILIFWMYAVLTGHRAAEDVFQGPVTALPWVLALGPSKVSGQPVFLLA